MTSRSSSSRSSSGQHWLGHSQLGSIGSNSSAAGILSRVKPFRSILENVSNTSNTRLSASSINIITALAQSMTNYPHQHPLLSYYSIVSRSANSSYNSLGMPSIWYPQHPSLTSYSGRIWRDALSSSSYPR